MAPPVTIRDVAHRAGVSTTTVSYVLNESRPVGEDPWKRVLHAVEELGYRPSVIAQGLKAGASRIIGFSWRPAPADQSNPILEKFIHSVAEATARHGYHVLTFPHPEPYDEVDVYREMVGNGRVDGFVLPNTRFDDQRIRYLLDVGFPFVAFGRSNPGLANCPDWSSLTVSVDGERFRLDQGELLDYRLQLDLRRGTLARDVRWRCLSSSTPSRTLHVI
jgi:DNA-binding LacI/PurR family transcriptional regulator